MFRLADPPNLFSRNFLDHFGAEDFLGWVPFDDLFDGAERAETLVAAVEEMGRMEKSRAGTVRLQDPQREFIGAINDLERSIVEDFMRRPRFGAERDCGRDVNGDGFTGEMVARVNRVS